MHLKSLEIRNFRKFGEENNSLDFVASSKTSTNKVAASTTLIVGKNNAGKTTVTRALKKILSNGNEIRGNDFNFSYLSKLLNGYIDKGTVEHLPSIEFTVVISAEMSETDLIHNLGDFLSISDTQAEDRVDLAIKVKFEIKEAEEFRAETKALILKFSPKRKLLFQKLIELLDATRFTCGYYGLDGERVKSNFNLSSLLEVKTILANNNLHDSNLSNIFNTIIKNKYLSVAEKSKLATLNDEIDGVNEKISSVIAVDHNASVNSILHQVESEKKLSVVLSSSLNFDKLTRNLIKYEYEEQGHFIPEGQFGLGYTNLMNIIGEIIDYVNEFPLESSQSKVHLICIEEPEAFMHPQMQESFIKYINNAVMHLLEGSGKKLHSQLIITTHSAHILNSKIHTSNSFDNINYLALVNNHSCVIKLTDDAVMGTEKFVAGGEESLEAFNLRRSSDLKFLKKHIKYKVSEFFFADAVIFVEGVTEETLLAYYLDNDAELKKYYISVLNINGAHGQVYLPLIKLIRIPALIITDIDIKRTEEEKFQKDSEGKKYEIYTQVNSLTDRVSTNTTIHKFNGAESNGLSNYIFDENMCCVFQKDPTAGFIATSFEESFILENYTNEILNIVLKKVKPDIYAEILGEELLRENIPNNSFKLQKKLSKNKSDFSNELLYQFIITDEKDLIPSLPKYVKDGLAWLKEQINKSIAFESVALEDSNISELDKII